MNVIIDELMLTSSEFAWQIRLVFRLASAMVLAAVIGWDRERTGHHAGLRTHILVGLGAALFTVVGSTPETDGENMAEIVKGVATGVGFLGAGAILKREESKSITGLTTAATIWMTAAIGLAAGAGWHLLAVAGAIFAWIVLSPLVLAAKKIEPHDKKHV